jgi:hypothetical protein
MTTKRQGFIVGVAALAVCWAATADAQGARPAQRCKSGHAPQQFPATGQTTTMPPAGHHEGDDGDIQAGATLSYTDNGDGTITDNNTCLVWEKKSGFGDFSTDSGIHRPTPYSWNDAFDVHVAALNTPPCFADHCDWRVPNVKELQSIVNYGARAFGPTVSPEFDSGEDLCAIQGTCTVTECSCTAPSVHWTSTRGGILGGIPFAVEFNGGQVILWSANSAYVRAVRGGSNLGPQR